MKHTLHSADISKSYARKQKWVFFSEHSYSLTLYEHIETAEQRTVTQQYGYLYTGC